MHNQPASFSNISEHASLAAIAAMTALEPPGLDEEGHNWQQQKGIRKRIAILDATVYCLEKYGYAQTSTLMIARKAKLSRGALLHHYATKLELISAVLDYAFYKRLESFMARTRALSDDQRVERLSGVEIYWNSLLTPEFAATRELTMAARTDPELRAILLPKHRRYDDLERQIVLDAFPEWQSKPRLYRLAMDFCITSMEGLLASREVWDDARRGQILRSLITQVLLMMRTGDITIAGVEDE